MEDKEYLRIIFNGLSKHYEYLPKYLKREQLKAEKDFIDNEEFVGRLIKAIQFLEKELNFLVSNEKHRFYLAKNGKNDEEIDAIVKDLSVQNYSLLISSYTNNEFLGHLWMRDIDYIKESMNEAFLYETVGEPITINLEDWLKGKDTDSEEKSAPIYQDDMEKNWFKVGVLFATGEMYDLKNKFDSYAKIAKHIYKDKAEGFRPYISESFSRTNMNHHNIFSSSEKIEKIKQFCEDMDLPISKKFLQ